LRVVHCTAEVPQNVTLRGYLEEAPVVSPGPRDRSLYAIPPEAHTTLLVQVQRLLCEQGWEEVSGRVRVHVQGTPQGLHLQDQVELTGLLAPFTGPANPGEPDFRSYAADAGIRARLLVRQRDGSVQRLERGWPGSLPGWLAWVRRWGNGVFEQ